MGIYDGKKFIKADLHMHTTFSDGTDKPEELLAHIREAGIDLFSVTDHDELMGSVEMMRLLEADDAPDKPAFVPGIEFSCRDEKGKYHILGYNYDICAGSVLAAVRKFHGIRMEKLEGRLRFLEKNFGIEFTDDEKRSLRSLNNPGKPHIGKILMDHGYGKNMKDAIDNFVSKYHGPEEKMRPEDAIEAVLKGGGIPVLAHGLFGDGTQLLDEEEMVERITRLIGYGLKGLECFYSGFSPKQERIMLSLAERFDMVITAGSDYHGRNKLVVLGDTGFSEPEDIMPYLDGFIKLL
ncbi:MAG: PHP domain-containing protein [Lachnospiraceae bacterium]|nr:PHP domain-containing protein [Lachnospiraceae bacterium]